MILWFITQRHNRKWNNLSLLGGLFAHDPSVSKMKGGSKIPLIMKTVHSFYSFNKHLLSTIWPSAGYQTITINTAYFFKGLRRQIFLWRIQPSLMARDNRGVCYSQTLLPYFYQRADSDAARPCLWPAPRAPSATLSRDSSTFTST